MKKSAPLLIFAAGSMWGCMGLLVRPLNEYGMNSMEIMALRSSVTCICDAVILLLLKREAFRIHIKDIWCFVGTGMFSVAFFSYCYFQTMALTSLSTAAILLYTAPAFVMLMSAVLFKEKLERRKLTALAFSFMGCALVTGMAVNGEAVTALAILTGLGAGFGYALYSIFGRLAIERGYSPFTITLYTFLFAGIGALPFVSYPKIAACFAENGKLAGTTFLLIVLTTVVPYFVYTLGLSHIEAGRASVIASIEPVAASMVGAALYKERISAAGIAGIALVIGSIALISGRTKTSVSSDAARNETGRSKPD